jgi:hypothetical protein
MCAAPARGKAAPRRCDRAPPQNRRVYHPDTSEGTAMGLHQMTLLVERLRKEFCHGRFARILERRASERLASARPWSLNRRLARTLGPAFAT